MIRVHVYEFTKGDFQRIPPDERALMLLAGHTLNQLGFWIKLIALSTNEPKADDFGRDRLNAAQSQILVRSLVAVLVEAAVWLRRKETYDLLEAIYLPILHEDARSSYAVFNLEFGRASKLLKGIRGSFSSHFPKADVINETFDKMPEDEDFSWYVTDEYTTSFYFGCEAVVGYGVMYLAEGDNEGEKLNKVLQTTMRVANPLGDFLCGLLAKATVRHFPSNPNTAVADITDAPGPTSSLPFYYEGVPGSRAQGEHPDPSPER